MIVKLQSTNFGSATYMNALKDRLFPFLKKELGVEDASVERRVVEHPWMGPVEQIRLVLVFPTPDNLGYLDVVDLQNDQAEKIQKFIGGYAFKMAILDKQDVEEYKAHQEPILKKAAENSHLRRRKLLEEPITSKPAMVSPINLDDNDYW